MKVFLIGGFGNYISQVLPFYGNKNVEFVVCRKSIFLFGMWTIHTNKLEKLLLEHLSVIGHTVYEDYEFSFFHKLFFSCSRLLKANIFGFCWVSNLNNVDVKFLSGNVAGYFQRKCDYYPANMLKLKSNLENFFNVKKVNTYNTIHIRLGDMNSIKSSVYRNVYVNVLCRNTSKTYIVTNDKNRAESLLHFSNDLLFGNCVDAVEDFSCLFNSNLIAVANSTFSRWAALLGNAKLIIALRSEKLSIEKSSFVFGDELMSRYSLLLDKDIEFYEPE
ncbi:hypothetical protein [Paraglaciecola sp.]|uniref:hypothetical protein n=1 Tax=Paraglaciecola sp. TaxID=1920173 RepID=UPI003EF6DDF0